MNEPLALGFDAYGTIFDTDSVDQALTGLLTDRAAAFVSLWRQKQIEFSFRRGLMRQYAPFNVCIRDALKYACFKFELDLNQEQFDGLMDEFRQLAIFDDVVPALSQLRDDGHQIYILSNGHPDDLQALLAHAGIAEFFIDVISVHEIESFKPDPEVYAHFIRRAGSDKSRTWLISGNTFDFVGAISYGIHAAHVKRHADPVIDPLEVEPTITVDSLLALRNHFSLA